jgi:ABC-type multidrug transport system ATPase subunit
MKKSTWFCEFTISFANLIIWADNKTCFKRKKQKHPKDTETSYEMYKNSFNLDKLLKKETQSPEESILLKQKEIESVKSNYLNEVSQILEQSISEHDPFDSDEVPILKNISGTVLSGSMTTIIGPSGSGKTTLMNFLSSRSSWSSNMYIDGDLFLNNFKVKSLSKYKHLIGFVPQEDILYETATVRENLEIYATMRGIKNPQKKVNSILKKLGLEKCADTIVGSALVRGVSGGERKRTCIGIELLGDPKILFLDEPTTGIDAHTALQVVQCLKNLNKEHNMTIVSVLHQPRQEIIELFDQVL